MGLFVYRKILPVLTNQILIYAHKQKLKYLIFCGGIIFPSMYILTSIQIRNKSIVRRLSRIVTTDSYPVSTMGVVGSYIMYINCFTNYRHYRNYRNDKKSVISVISVIAILLLLLKYFSSKSIYGRLSTCGHISVYNYFQSGSIIMSVCVCVM